MLKKIHEVVFYTKPHKPLIQVLQGYTCYQ